MRRGCFCFRLLGELSEGCPEFRDGGAMAKYRKKPVVIEAEQLIVGSDTDLPESE